MYPTQLHSYLLWRSSVEPNPQQLASKRYTAAASLVPAVMCGIFVYGWYASMVLLACLAGAFVADQLGRRVIYRREQEFFLKRDGVWILTGLLVGLMLPPALPWYWAAAGSFAAVLAGKYWLQVDGTPLFQPALLGLLALHLVCPLVMAMSGEGAANPMNPRGHWPVLERGTSLETPAEGNFAIPKFLRNFFGGDIRNAVPRQKYLILDRSVAAEAVSGPRPQDYIAEMPSRDLSSHQQVTNGESAAHYDWLNMLLGGLPGTIGASSGMALLMGVFLLVFSRTLSPLTPVSALLTMLAGFYLVAWIGGQGADARVMYGNIPIHLLSGGTLLALFYFACDPAVGARSKRGKIYAGIFFGIVELIFRIGFRFSDALPISLLLTQGMSFVIDQWLAPPSMASASSVHIGLSQSSLGRL